MLIILRNIFIIISAFFSFSFVCYGVSEPEVSADCAVIIDADTAEILYEKNPHKQRSMASTTKIMTALIALESGKADDIVKINDEIYIEGTAIGLKKGDALTLRDLCYGMLLESGNDAAVAAAIFLAEDEAKFRKMMNEKAYEIGMKNTNFVTSSGLDADNHYSTAYDMALLGAYAIKNADFIKICSLTKYTVSYISPKKEVRFSNHNKLLYMLDGAIGIKTGFTKKSGRCLVSACERDNKRLVAVTLAAPDDWNDHIELYEYGYSLYKNCDLPLKIPDKISVFGSEVSDIQLKLQSDNNLQILKNSKISAKIIMNRLIYAPLKVNDCVGKVKLFQNNKEIKELNIISIQNAPVSDSAIKYKPGFKDKIINFFKKFLY